MKKLFYFLFLCGAVLLTACSKSTSPFETSVEYIPFQEEKDGYWGMIAPDGKVLFAGEFKEEPTVVVKGRFFVKNADGMWELYTAEEKPKKIGGEYLEVVMFNEDVTPVVRENHNIELINLDGQPVCTLEKIEGKRVLEVRGFYEGLAVFKTSAGYGCINTKGEVVIKPQYAEINPCCEGKILAVDNKYKDTGKENRKYCVLDKSGNVKSEFTLKNVEDIALCFKDGLLPVEQKDENGETKCGLLDENGEWVVKPSSKMRAVAHLYGGNFVYGDGDGYGLKNLEGETVIRAKYKSLVFASNDILIYENEKGEYGLLDVEGNKLFDDTYRKLFGMFADKYLLAKEGADDWLLIDKEGNAVSNKVDIYNVGFNMGNGRVCSDYFSYEALFDEIGVTKDGLGKFVYNMKAADAAACCADGNSEVAPARYTASKSVNYGETILKCSVTYGAVFTENMAAYDSNGNCSFSDTKAKAITVIIPVAGKLDGKAEELYDAAKACVAKIGKKVPFEADGTLYDLGNGRQILVMNNNASVIMIMAESKDTASAKAENAGDDADIESDEAFQLDNAQPQTSGAQASAGALSNLLGTRKLTYSDISGLDKAQLRLLRNEIYARHGYIFNSADLKAHFSKFSWYKPLYTDVTSKMSAIEKYNAAFIKKYE